MEIHQAVLMLSPDDQGRSVSAEEFAGAEFLEPWSYEREEVKLLVMPPDSPDHDRCSEPIRDHLGAYRLSFPLIVEEVFSECWVQVDEGTDRIGDIGVFLVGNRSAVPRPKRVPEIIFEVVSPDRKSRERDYVKKRKEYADLGVLEYVVVDRLRRRVTVYASYPLAQRKRVLLPEDRYVSALLPGLEIPLGDVL
jgi:Uma2 family endonuclease